jgi:hypothetical protein
MAIAKKQDTAASCWGPMSESSIYAYFPFWEVGLRELIEYGFPIVGEKLALRSLTKEDWLS